jgi:hypothetical protein
MTVSYYISIKLSSGFVSSFGIHIGTGAALSMAAVSHLTSALDSITDDTWRAPAAKYFTGKIIVGKDLMVV